MLAIQIDEVKPFMQKLLLGSDFDPFLFVEGALQMGITYTFDGHLNKDFFSEEERAKLPQEEIYIPYSQVRPILFSLIRGKRTPLSFHMTMQLPADKTALLLAGCPFASTVKSLLFNLRFDGQKVLLTSGVNYSTFSLDKSPERAWEEELKLYFPSGS